MTKLVLAASVGAAALLVAVPAARAGHSGPGPYVDQIGGGAGGHYVQQVDRGPGHFGSLNDGHDGRWPPGGDNHHGGADDGHGPSLGGDDHHGIFGDDRHASSHGSSYDGHGDWAWGGHGGFPFFPGHDGDDHHAGNPGSAGGDHDHGHDGGPGTNVLIQAGDDGIQAVRFDDGTRVLQQHGNGNVATMTVAHGGSFNLVGAAQLGSGETVRDAVGGDKNVLLVGQGVPLPAGLGDGGTPSWVDLGAWPGVGSSSRGTGSGSSGNSVEASQTGEANLILVGQTGSGNRVTIDQGGGAGTGGPCGAGASGGRNVAAFQQSGTGNIAAATQSGSGNRISVVQR